MNFANSRANSKHGKKTELPGMEITATKVFNFPNGKVQEFDLVVPIKL